MKIRAGFVSNSSSSSFLVKLPKDFVITPENVHRLMFGGDDETSVEYYGDPVSSRDLAAIVAGDLLNTMPNDAAKISEEIGGEGGPDYDDFQIPVSPRDPSYDPKRSRFGNMDHAARGSAQNRYDKVVMEKYLETHKDVNTYVVSYSDESGGNSTILEHSGVLEGFSTRYSHH